MENTKFTPGPWLITNLLEYEKGTGSLTIGSEKSDWIAEVKGTHVGNHSQEEVYANAKLIAAAPELLEALIEAEKHHQGMRSEMGWKIRNAIKKATGVEVNYQGSEYYK